MRCPYCGAETFKRKPHLDPNNRSRQKYLKAEQDQYLSHVRKCNKRR